MNHLGYHICQWENVLQPQAIDGMMNTWHIEERNGNVITRLEAEGHEDPTFKRDTSASYNIISNQNLWPLDHLKEFINEQALPDYRRFFDINNGIWPHTHVSDMKMQKTKPQEGYHLWHCEYHNHHTANSRVLAFTLYLNDITDGGETEFLHQHMRVKPVQNRFIMWPAYFTHLHRGNPPLKKDKYIVTGWVEAY